MNRWVAAAATGACYVAKYCWHKWFFKRREGLSESINVEPDIFVDSGSESTAGANEEHLGKLIETSGELSDFVLKKGRPCVRRRDKGYSFKAMNSIESCLLAQMLMCREQDDVYSLSAASPCRTSVHINEVLLDTEEFKHQMKCRFEEEFIGLFEERNQKQSMGKARRRRTGRKRCSCSSTSVSGGPFHSQGSENGMLLFCVGITIGVMHTTFAYRSEVDKLNELLKQTQKSVRDVHEEVEMKDALNLEEFSSYGLKFREAHRTADDAKPMSKMEAELLAELELLELNINAQGFSRTPDTVKLDPELRADVIQENLKHKAVSPRELSLRLHEVIEARLEARIIELETALEASEKRVVHFYRFVT